MIRVVAYDIGLAAGPLHFVEGPEAFGVCFQMREHLDPGEAWVAVSSFFEAALQCGKQRFALVGGKGFVVHVWVPHGLQVFQVVQVFVSAAGFFVTLQIFQIDEAHFHPIQFIHHPCRVTCFKIDAGNGGDHYHAHWRRAHPQDAFL